MCEQPEGLLNFCRIYNLYEIILPSWLSSLTYLMSAITLAFAVINMLIISTALYTWFERRTLARFQSRIGPNRWGPFGLLQPIADVVKAITKEDTVPESADKIVFNLAPILLLITTLLVIVVIPLGPDSFMGSLNIGVIFIIGVTSINTIAIFMGGWASRNKYAMFGAMRSVAMLITYEIPMGIAIVGILLLSNSLALSDIVMSQTIPFFIVQPIGFFVFFAASIAEISRTPFDQIEAESELGSGFHTEYSGIKFAIITLAEFMAPIISAIIITTLYLGGFKGPNILPAEFWFAIKVFILIFFMLWIRATWPRLRIDQIMNFAWKPLFGLGLFNLFATAIEIIVFQDNATGFISTSDYWIISGINWMFAIVLFFAITQIMGSKNKEKIKHSYEANIVR
ncbi:MAG: NADH-quinone oxidoreductase subunit NuoH [Chloroflexi bacterium]|nr:NADH-quinone oxidoreductase subunit NuoH [Chloroflexota bacterium]|tara:strand:- start:31262 stop:32455 length:1194 start_codon:yes stop_codon:yes gene_type:complete